MGKGGPGFWRFNTDLTRPTYRISIRESDSPSTVAAKVRSKYHLSDLIEPPITVLLTYEFPYFESERGAYTTPPTEIITDRDVENFMALQIDCPWVELYVTLGGGHVERYWELKEDVEAMTLPYRGNSCLIIY